MTFENYDDGRKLVEQALEHDFIHTVSEADGERTGTTIVTGPGTVLRYAADERIKEIAAEQQKLRYGLQNGLIVPAPLVSDKQATYRLIVLNGASQVDPELEFESFEAAQAAVAGALEDTFLHYEVALQDDLWVKLGTGITMLTVSKEGAERRRRNLVEQAMRAQQLAQTRGAPPVKKLIMPD